MTPTARSLAHLRKEGYAADVVERRVHRWVTRDLFGCLDLVAIRATEPGVLGVQTTSSSNVAARRAKIAAEPRARLWLACGNRIVVHGWALRGAQGERKRWTLREVEMTLEDFEHGAAAEQVAA